MTSNSFFMQQIKRKMVIWSVSGRLVCDNSDYANFAQDVEVNKTRNRAKKNNERSEGGSHRNCGASNF